MTAATTESIEQRVRANRRGDARTGSDLGPASGFLARWRLAAIVTVPILLYFARALQPGTSRTCALAIPNFGKTLVTTVGLAAGSTVIGAVIAVAMAAAVARIPGRRQSIASSIPLLPLVVPPVALVYGWIFIFSPSRRLRKRTPPDLRPSSGT